MNIDVTTPLGQYVAQALAAMIADGTIAAEANLFPGEGAIVNAAGQWWLAAKGNPGGLPGIAAPTIDELRPFVASAVQWWVLWGNVTPSPELFPWNDIPWLTVKWEWILGGGYAVDWAAVGAALDAAGVGMSPSPVQPDFTQADWNDPEAALPWGLMDWSTVPWRQIPWSALDLANVGATTGDLLAAITAALIPDGGVGPFPPPGPPTPPDDDPPAPAPPKAKGYGVFAVVGILAVAAVATVAVVAVAKSK